jgi:hypothetical protein
MEVVSNIPQHTRSALDAPLEGMRKAEKLAADAADRLAKGDVEPEPVVDLIQAEHIYTANAKVVQVHDERTGQLLEALA